MGFFGNNAALNKIDRDIASIADGNADLSHTVGSAGGGTAGQISANINRFFARIRGLISHARERSVSIASDAAQMNHLVQLTGDAVRRQEALASDIFASSNRVNLAVSEVATNSDAIQSSTQNNLDLAQRSLEQMETVASTMRSTRTRPTCWRSMRRLKRPALARPVVALPWSLTRCASWPKRSRQRRR